MNWKQSIRKMSKHYKYKTIMKKVWIIIWSAFTVILIIWSLIDGNLSAALAWFAVLCCDFIITDLKKMLLENENEYPELKDALYRTRKDRDKYKSMYLEMEGRWKQAKIKKDSLRAELHQTRALIRRDRFMCQSEVDSGTRCETRCTSDECKWLNGEPSKTN